MHEVLVNRLGGLSLPRKSVVRLTDRPDMTLDVYRGRKTTIQQQQQLFRQTGQSKQCRHRLACSERSSLIWVYTVYYSICIIWIHCCTEKPNCSICRTVVVIFRYHKNSKNWDTWNNYHNCPTIGTVGFYSAVLCLKDADRITNREDPDQTAPWGAVWSGSALFAQTYLSQYLKLLRYPSF